MILISNLSGLLVIGVSIVLGAIALVGSGSVALALVVMALAWIVFGGRRTDRQTGAKRPYPSVFFVPLRFAAVVPLLAAGIAFVADRALAERRNDPRYALLQADEAALRQRTVSGDAELSRALREHMLQADAFRNVDVDAYSIFTRKNADAVLVLVQAPDLSKLAPAVRESLAESIVEFLKFKTPGRPLIYIGIKGRVAYGAMCTPRKNIETGGVLDETLLYSFYGVEPEPTAATGVPSV